MSRTFRKHLDCEYIINGNIIHWKDLDRKIYPIGMGYCCRYKIKTVRDGKPWNKPDKQFKQMKRRIERAQVRDAMNKKNELPRFPKTDQWDWT